MEKQLKQVQEFADTYKVPTKTTPTLIDKNRYELRYNLIQEETDEYLKACMDGDLVEIADALGDTAYILLGTILEMGMGDIIEKVITEIHASNMSKLDEHGQPIYREDGKILKGKNYFKPNLKQFIDTNN